MARLIVAERADVDVDDIFETIRRSTGYAAVAGFDGALSRLYERLAAFPKSGPARPALGRDIRIAIAAPYIVIYRYDVGDDTVTILRIVHGHRRMDPRLLRSAL